jgi:hypothetical protein
MTHVSGPDKRILAEEEGSLVLNPLILRNLLILQFA